MKKKMRRIVGMQPHEIYLIEKREDKEYENENC
jgi:hypothetical protein